MQSQLVVHDVQITYRSERTGATTVACQNLTLTVEPGEFVAIVGPSGCGKTTFLSAVAGLIPISFGSLSLDGREITEPGPDRSVVFQQPSLLPWRTVTGNIRFALEAVGRIDDKTPSRIKELLRLVGLDDRPHAYPSELSGGMSQRVNLARALSIDPQLLLLDEPFASLDAQTRDKLQDELVRIWQLNGVAGTAKKTAVFITHDVSEAVFLADRVVVFSSRPAHVVETITIDLERPRVSTVKQTPLFAHYVNQVRNLISKSTQDVLL